MEHKESQDLLKMFFKKREDFIIKEDDFFEQSYKFQFLSLLISGNVFDFKGHFQALKKETYFTNSQNNLKKRILVEILKKIWSISI